VGETNCQELIVGTFVSLDIFERREREIGNCVELGEQWRGEEGKGKNVQCMKYIQ
jgi:hypothetical protein